MFFLNNWSLIINEGQNWTDNNKVFFIVMVIEISSTGLRWTQKCYLVKLVKGIPTLPHFTHNCNTDTCMYKQLKNMHIFSPTQKC